MSSPAAPPASPARRGLPGIARNVVALGFVSLLTDLSSDMIVPVLPLFVTVVLGASVVSLGVIEGAAECASSLLRLVSGRLSDRAGSRKPFVFLGYAISTFAKGGLALAGSWTTVLGLRVGDRVGKAVRNPPRDALIADATEQKYLGRAFGLHRAMDTAGACLGPLVAFWLLSAFPGDYRRVFAAATIPAVLSLAVLAVFVRVPRRPDAEWSEGAAAPAARASMGPAFRRFLAVAGAFSFASSSLAFLLLQAGRVGFGPAQVTLVYLGYNVVYALLSWPLGEWSDRIGRRPLVLASYVLFAVVYAVLAVAHTPFAVAGAFLTLGVHAALIEGQQRSLLADLAPPDRRATAFGYYYTVVGLAVLPGNLVAGALWSRFGAPATFALDAAVALVAAVLFLWWLPPGRELAERHVAHAA